MIRLEPHRQGVLVPVNVKAAARRTGVAGERGGAVRIDVAAAPEKGKANQAAADVLAELFGAPRSAIELISGATSRHKRFLIVGVTVAAATDRIAAALGGRS